MSKRDQQFINKIKTITFGTGAKLAKKAKFDPAIAIKKFADQDDPGYDHQVKVVGKVPMECDDCGKKAVGVLACVSRSRKDNPDESSLSA